MKALFLIALTIVISSTINAQDIFVFKNGTVQTRFTILQDLPQMFQVECAQGKFSIHKDKLSFVQKASGEQIVFDNAAHKQLKIFDLQEVNQEQCFKPKYAQNNADIPLDNQTPGTKATVNVTKATLYKNRCLSVQSTGYVSQGDVVTIEKADEIVTDPPFEGSYLICYMTKDGVILKGWIKSSAITITR